MLSKEEIEKENSEWEKLCNECSNVAKSVGFTKEDTDRIIKETREMQWKAKKYDELIEKLEEANKLDKQTVQAYENMYRNATEEFYKRSYKRTIDIANARRETRKSILEIVKGVENERNKI